MLEEVVQKILKKSIATQYPHLKLPAVVYASITSAKKLGETFNVEELVIYNEAGGSYKGHITANWYEYAVRIVDCFGNPDVEFPLIPGIRSKKQFQTGALVAVALPYGELSPAIIGEVEL